MSLLSAIFLLFIVLDPLGNIPLFVCILKDVDEKRHKWIILRESLIGLGILLLFLFAGRVIMDVLHISQPALGVAGGIILFLIAVKMVFSRSEEIFGNTPEGEPLIVPLAVPFIAGPSTICTVMLLMARDPVNWQKWLIAVIVAWTLSLVLLLCSDLFYKILNKRGLSAVENLMGLLLTAVAVEMFMSGVKEILATPVN